MRLLATGLILFMTAACGLNKTADHMKAETDRIRLASDHLAKRTDDLENELTFKESSAMMMQFMRYLWGEDNASTFSRRAPTQVDSIVYAGAVMKSMWFQFWKGDFHEDLASLDERFELGAEILLARVKAQSDFYHTVDAGKFAGTGFKGASALAAKLDFVRPEFTYAITHAGQPAISFYDVLVMALRERDKVEPGGLFPRATRKILEFSGEAEYLLQLRHNTLPAMVMSSVADLKDHPVKVVMLQHSASHAVPLSAFNPTQLREWTRWLRLAHQTRDDLRSLNIQPKINRDVRTVQRHLAPKMTLVHGKSGAIEQDFVRAWSDLD